MARRYAAPAGDGEVLADPPPERVAGLVEANRRRLARPGVVVGGLPLPELRALARREVLGAALEYTASPPAAAGGLAPESPLLLAGHQPELSHPGVWAKHFALNGLARRLGGVPLNLVVDNDTLKSTALRLPVYTRHDPTTVRVESVAFDAAGGETPYEERRVLEAEAFRTFAGRAAPLWKNWNYEPLLPSVWRDVLATDSPLIGEKFAAARRKREREWGCHNLELPVSRLSRTEAFRRFVADIAGQVGRFRHVYNTAVAAYRRANGLKSDNHPVPDLAAGELPFWGPPDARGRRTRPTAPTELIRPRALTLTLFARVCLGDFFIHGIGGGKYDEVTDRIVRDYFGIEPPAYQVLSATLHLPLPAFPTEPGDVAALARRERDVYWNPQRHVPGPEAERPEVVELSRRQRELAATVPADHAGRLERWRALRAVGDQLRELLLPKMGEAHDWLGRARQEAAANAVLRRRDFAWVLYPADVLRPFLQRFL